MIFLDKLAALLTPKRKRNSSKIDFLERLATLLTPKSKKTTPRNGINGDLIINTVDVKKQINTSNKQVPLSLEKENIPNLLKIENKVSFAEQNFKSPDKIFNDNFSDLYPHSERYKLNDASLIEKILPFLKSHIDFPNWVYRNRHSVFTIVALYLALLLGFTMVEFTFDKSVPLPDGIYIEFMEEEPEKEKQQEIDITDKDVTYDNVGNKISDENSTLEEEVEMEYEMTEPINSEELLKEAELLDEAIRQNMLSYTMGKDSLDNEIEIERNIARNHRDSLRKMNDDDRFNTTRKKGNVTVSYNLKNRYALYLEIPAYRCEGGGKVVIDIVVNRAGVVVSAVVKQTYGVTDDCVEEMAVWATKLAQFNIDNNASVRQKGTMTYIFVAQ